MDIELHLGHNADVIPPYYNDEPYFSNYLAKIIGYDEKEHLTLMIKHASLYRQRVHWQIWLTMSTL